MRPFAATMLVRLYPRAWRERYGAEFAALLEERPVGMRAALNVMGAAMRERMAPTVGGAMEQQIYSFGAITRKPSAFVPLAMSAVTLTMLLGAIAVGFLSHKPLVRDPDEGPMAHIFQLLMTVQMPIVLFFAVKWMRGAPRQTLGLLALQAGAWLAACAPVYFLHL